MLVYCSSMFQAALLRDGEALHKVRVIDLLAVTAIVGEKRGTEDEVVATLLHNAPENQDGEERLKDFQHALILLYPRRNLLRGPREPRG